MGSVSTKVQISHITYDESIEWCKWCDESIEWCSNRKVQFKYLEINTNYIDISTKAASLLSKCCIDMVELKLGHYNCFGNFSIEALRSIKSLVNEFAKCCSKLKKILIISLNRSESDIIPLIACNPDLEEININSFLRSDEVLFAISTHCHRLRRISFIDVDLSDQGITALVTANHGLEEIGFSKCSQLTDVSLITIAEHCHKLRLLKLQQCNYSDQGVIALISKNPDLKSVYIDCELITEATTLAIAALSQVNIT